MQNINEILTSSPWRTQAYWGERQSRLCYVRENLIKTYPEHPVTSISILHLESASSGCNQKKIFPPVVLGVGRSGLGISRIRRTTSGCTRAGEGLFRVRRATTAGWTFHYQILTLQLDAAVGECRWRDLARGQM